MEAVRFSNDLHKCDVFSTFEMEKGLDKLIANFTHVA